LANKSTTNKGRKNEKPISQALWRWVGDNEWLKIVARDSARPHQNARWGNRDSSDRRSFGVRSSLYLQCTESWVWWQTQISAALHRQSRTSQ